MLMFDWLRGPVVAVLQDTHFGIRRETIKALTRMSTGPGTSSGALAVASIFAEDPEVEVRRAAVRALIQLAEVGDDAAVSAVVQLLGDHDDTVRHSAIWAMTEVVEPSDVRGISALCGLLEDPAASVRRAAVNALVELIPKATTQPLYFVKRYMENDRIEVRHAAAEVIERISIAKI
jgi:HEAT repeat protein